MKGGARFVLRAPPPSRGRACEPEHDRQQAQAVTICRSDALETSTQLRITTVLPGGAVSLTLLAIGSRGKFFGLAITSICAGPTIAIPFSLFAEATFCDRLRKVRAERGLTQKQLAKQAGLAWVFVVAGYHGGRGAVQVGRHSDLLGTPHTEALCRLGRLCGLFAPSRSRYSQGLGCACLHAPQVLMSWT